MNLSMETREGPQGARETHQVRTESLGRVVTSIRADILSLWEESGIEKEDARKQEFPSTSFLSTLWRTPLSMCTRRTTLVCWPRWRS